MSNQDSQKPIVPSQTTIEQYTLDDMDPIRGYPELRWAGKRPFRSTQYYPAQLKETYGPEVDGNRNELYWGDNLQVMSHLLKRYTGSVQLVYIDPPFDSRAEYQKKIELRGAAIAGDLSSFEEKQYSDIWTNDEYLQFMFERLLILRRLLSDSGSIFLHCDWNQSHHLRCLLDEVFGPSNFRNEIYWYYYNKMPDTRKGNFPRSTDTILWYAKNRSSCTFNALTEQRDEPVKQLVRKKLDGKMVNARDEEGNVMYRMAETRVIDNVWRLSMLQPADRTENLGYPTQKPETVLERVIKAASNPGDLVLDCFMGSGTTQAVAMRMGRRFIGCDINLGAIQTATRRLINLGNELRVQKGRQATLLEGGQAAYAGFNVFNVNNYDVFRSPTQARELLLEALEIQPLQAGGLYDGEKDGRMVKIMPINRIATRQDLNELINNFNYRLFEKRKKENPRQPVEKLLLICMGHEPDLRASLETQVDYDLDVEVVDILRDSDHLQFRRDSDARLVVRKNKVLITAFYPMNLLQKLSVMKEDVGEWRELVDSVMIDFNYDGAVLQPTVVDVPEDGKLVAGSYDIPPESGTIRVKITDVLSESWEGEVTLG